MRTVCIFPRLPRRRDEKRLSSRSLLSLAVENLEPRQFMAADMMGVVRGANQWLLDSDFDPTHEIEDSFGQAGDRYVTGKWNGRFDLPGVVHGGKDGLLYWRLATDGDENYDLQIVFGRIGDQVIVGDWDGDGRDNVGVARATTSGDLLWLLDFNGDLNPERSFVLGRATDIAVAGDWDGDGRSTAGVVHALPDGMLHWMLDLHGNGSTAERAYGLTGDRPIAGDWNDDGVMDVGVVRSGSDGLAQWYFDTTGDKWADKIYSYGFNTDQFVVGAWQGVRRSDETPKPAARLTGMLSTSGTLTVDGTDGSDDIDLRQSGSQITLSGSNIVYAGKARNSVTASQVKRIEVRGFGGDDTIRLNQGSTTIAIPATLYGGDGMDTIAAGNGSDTIYGGATPYEISANTAHLVTGDFDGDHLPDKLVYSYEPQYGLVIQNQLTNPAFAAANRVITLGDGPASGPLFAADLNGDGRDELIFHDYDRQSGLYVRVKELNANGSWTSQQYSLD